jgi:hypothetical protein
MVIKKQLIYMMWINILLVFPLNANNAEFGRLAKALTFLKKENVVSEPVKPKEPKKTDEEEELTAIPGSESVQILPTQMKLTKETVTIKIPGLGDIVFTPIYDKEKEVRGFKSIFPPKDKTIDWGVIKIDSGEFRIVDGKLSFLAPATFFGHKAKIGIKQSGFEKKEQKGDTQTVEIYKLVLGLSFDEGVSIELIPGQKITTKEIDLILEEGKPIIFKQAGEVFGQKSELSAEIDIKNKTLTVKGEIQKQSLTKTVPELEDTPLKGLYVEGTFSYTTKDGLIMQGSLTSGEGEKGRVVIAGVELHDAFITINTKKKYGLVEGATTILGLKMKWYCVALLDKTKALQCAAEVLPDVKEWQPFKDSAIKELQAITVHSIKAGFKAEYVAQIAGKKEELSKEEEDKKKGVKKTPESKVEETEEKEEELVEFVLKDGEPIEFSPEKGFTFSLYIDGKSTILNTTSDVSIKIAKAASGFGATLVFGLPKGWSLAQSLPELKAKPNSREPRDMVLDTIDLIKLSKARIIASTRKDTINDEEVEPGLNVMADVTIELREGNNVAVALKDLVQQTGSEGASLQLRGNINPFDVKAMMFKIALATRSFKFTVGPNIENVGPATFEAGKCYIVIRGKPEVGFGGEFTVRPTPKDQPIEFSGEFLATPIDVGISTSMKGLWTNPLGVKGFEFGNLALTGTQTWTALAEAAATAGVAALVPATLGISGDMRLGKAPCGDPKSFCGKMRFNFGKKFTELAAVVDIDNPHNIVGLFDVLLEEMGAQPGAGSLVEQVNKIAPLKVEKAKLYFVPFGTTIGTIKVEQGIGSALYLDMFGRKAFTDTMVSLNGITAKGFISAFKIGSLEMNSADDTCDAATGLAKEPTTIKAELLPDPILVQRPTEASAKNNVPVKLEKKAVQLPCGPTIDIGISLKEQKFIIDGLMKIGDFLQSRTKWHMTAEGIIFDTKTSIGPKDGQMSIHLKGKSVPFDLAKFVELQPKDIGIEITFEDNLREKINKATLDFLNEKQKDFEGQINDAIEMVVRKATAEDIERQKAVVRQAEGNRVWCSENLSLCLERERIVTAEKIKLAAMEIKYAIEKTVIGDVLREIMDKLGLTKLIEQALKDIRQLGVAAFEQGKFTFKKISEMVIIKRIHWEGDLSNISAGKIPSITIDLILSGKPVTRKLGEFNLLQPMESIDQISKNLAQLAVDSVKSVLNIPIELPKESIGTYQYDAEICSKIEQLSKSPGFTLTKEQQDLLHFCRMHTFLQLPNLTASCKELMQYESEWKNPDGTPKIVPGVDPN